MKYIRTYDGRILEEGACAVVLHMVKESNDIEDLLDIIERRPEEDRTYPGYHVYGDLITPDGRHVTVAGYNEAKGEWELL